MKRAEVPRCRTIRAKMDVSNTPRSARQPTAPGVDKGNATRKETVMSDGNAVDVKVGADLVRPIIEAKIHAAVVEALKSTPQVTEQIVARMLTTRCDRSGKVSEYHSHNKHTIVEVVMMKTIEGEVQKVLADWVEKSKPQIAESFRRQLEKKSQVNALTKAFLAAITEAMQSKWRMSITYDNGE